MPKPGRKKFRDRLYIKMYNQLYYLNKLVRQRELEIESNKIDPITKKRTYENLSGQTRIKKLNLEQINKVLNPTVKIVQSNPIIVKFD
jgi:hypothetical protein